MEDQNKLATFGWRKKFGGRVGIGQGKQKTQNCTPLICSSCPAMFGDQQTRFETNPEVVPLLSTNMGVTK